MSKEVQILKARTVDNQQKESQAAELQQSEQNYELRRENFRLAADVRRLKLDNDLLRSDERAKKEEAVYQEIAKVENSLEDMRCEKLAVQRENAKLLARIRQMEAQILTIKQERDRLLELSSELKVQVTQTEKKKLLLSNASQHAQTDRVKLNEMEERKTTQSEIFNIPMSQSIQQERRKANIGGVMSYGDTNIGVIGEDKQADIA